MNLSPGPEVIMVPEAFMFPVAFKTSLNVEDADDMSPATVAKLVPVIVVPDIAPVDTSDPTDAVDEAENGPMTVRLALIVEEALETIPPFIVNK